MKYEQIRFERLEAGIHLLTVDRPHALNALNRATLKEMQAAIDAVEADSAARVLLITGAGTKAFVAGADIAEMQSMSALEAKAFSAAGLRTFRQLETLSVPTIAVVSGYCLGGGCELAMSCDWIVAAENARFGQPEVGLGVIPGFGGTQRLSRRVGSAVALEWITTARTVDAEEAWQLGLVNHVYPVDALQAEALQMARSVASKAPVAVRLAKEAVQRGQDLDLENACVLENTMFALSFSSVDRDEGMAAFLEKRAPQFSGR